MLETKMVGGVLLPPPPIMIGAGACKTVSSTKDWLQVAPVVSGSYTLDARVGNLGDRLFFPDTLEEFLAGRYAYNWFGMPNVGITRLLAELQILETSNPVIISVAGFCVADYVWAVALLADLDVVAGIELNFGCQNTEHGVPMSFDLESMQKVFAAIRPFAHKPIWAKFSPYVGKQERLLSEVALLVHEYCDVIKAVVTCNTLRKFAGKEKISSPDGFASLSGSKLKALAMRQLTLFRCLLPDDIDIISVGGITTGNDVIERLDTGASAVQLTSLPFYFGRPNLFWEHLLNPETGSRLIELLER